MIGRSPNLFRQRLPQVEQVPVGCTIICIKINNLQTYLGQPVDVFWRVIDGRFLLRGRANYGQKSTQRMMVSNDKISHTQVLAFSLKIQELGSLAHML